MQNVSKRTILWIVPVIIIVIFWYFYGPKEEITDNEYITYIKDTSLSGNGEATLDDAFSSFCNEGKWVYFKTQKNQNVVEFKGACPVEGKVNDINLQFVVEDDKTGYQVGVLLLDGVQQTEEDRDQFLNMVVTN
ncbi:glucosamine 6-phosphate synthetase [Lysinibacillus telephonicus]|uniref:Glucosamine 6-phosphate synthetase n=1 Tax=Lysinibacillus telephonicus TaxID=1714840 RepID=A0A3S0HGU5_9BACI|nr:glucosamine 6-phosphate synthetase [Lysinibacillus telephonicus]RTQ91323.1 glucosamine 6-phosphate synthetase [Lysinibacillus telephonicus]